MITGHAKLPIIDGLISASKYFAQCFAHSGNETETLWVAHTDSHYRVTHLSRDPGDQHHVDFPVRGIIMDIVRNHTKALVIAHNHPSGDPRPSTSDKMATRRLCLLADALGCSIADHLIFAGDKIVSLRAQGLL